MKVQTCGEEIANSITHGIATLLSIAGLVILAVVSAAEGSAWAVTSLSIFGATLIVLYLAVTLVVLRGAWGWSLFGLILGMALMSVLINAFTLNRFKTLSVLSCLMMSWLVVVAIKPLTQACPQGLILWLLIGGCSYTLGMFFYSWEKLPCQYAIWHLFVLGGSTAHFSGMPFNIASV